MNANELRKIQLTIEYPDIEYNFSVDSKKIIVVDGMAIVNKIDIKKSHCTSSFILYLADDVD